MDIDIFYLDWDKELKQFSGPSDVIALLFGEGRGVPPDYPTLVNPKTGGTCKFNITRRERDRDGSIVAWHYISVTDTPTMTLILS